MKERIATLLLEAVSCIAPSRVSDTVRGWLARLDLSSLPPAMEAEPRWAERSSGCCRSRASRALALPGSETWLRVRPSGSTMGFVRPGRSSLINPLRCADAVYRHVLRHGTKRVPGLNEPLPGEETNSRKQATRSTNWLCNGPSPIISDGLTIYSSSVPRPASSASSPCIAIEAHHLPPGTSSFEQTVR